MSINRHRGVAGLVFWPTCDGCGRQLPPETCWADARGAMAQAKWKLTKDPETGWTHLCPVCAQEDE